MASKKAISFVRGIYHRVHFWKALTPGISSVWYPVSSVWTLLISQCRELCCLPWLKEIRTINEWACLNPGTLSVTGWFGFSSNRLGGKCKHFFSIKFFSVIYVAFFLSFCFYFFAKQSTIGIRRCQLFIVLRRCRLRIAQLSLTPRLLDPSDQKAAWSNGHPGQREPDGEPFLPWREEEVHRLQVFLGPRRHSLDSHQTLGCN